RRLTAPPVPYTTLFRSERDDRPLDRRGRGREQRDALRARLAQIDDDHVGVRRGDAREERRDALDTMHDGADLRVRAFGQRLLDQRRTRGILRANEYLHAGFPEMIIPTSVNSSAKSVRGERADRHRNANLRVTPDARLCATRIGCETALG